MNPSSARKIAELLKLAQEHRERRHEYCDTPENIPERIRIMLKYFGITPKKFGLIIGVSESTVKRWLRGQGTRRAHRLLSFSKLEELFLEYSRGPLRIGREHMWYNCKNECLSGITPIECMAKNQSAGIYMVAGLLNSIRYGLPS